MIVGNGMIARRFAAEFAADPETLIFASGVSHSKLNDEHAFVREETLLLKTIENYPHMKLVYFSTCAIYDPSLQETPYILHKLNMENLIQQRCQRYLICRVTNLVGKSDNPATLINFLVGKIETGEPFSCWDGSVRNMLDLDDFYQTVKEILYRLGSEEKRTVNIFCPVSYGVVEIIAVIERHLMQQALFTREQKGSVFKIPGLGFLVPVYKRVGLQFDKDYLRQLLVKYFPAVIMTSQAILN